MQNTSRRHLIDMESGQEQPLVSLTYVSSAVKKLDDHELLEILRTARKNNERLGVTGMLLYQDGNFMQTLEGPETAVKWLIEIIAEDPRHHGVIRLLEKQIPERSFAEWSMAFHHLDEMSAEDSRAVSPFLAGSLLDDSFRQRPENSYKLMLSFKANCRR